MRSTPFEIALRHALGDEFIRMDGQWFFQWHNLSIQGRTVDVDDFFGRRLQFGGVKFESQTRDIYWSSVEKYLVNTMPGKFRQWQNETSQYASDLKNSSLAGTSIILSDFTFRILRHAKDTDRRLRGQGFPEDVISYNVSEICERLAIERADREAAYARMIVTPTTDGKPKTPLKKMEDWFTAWRSTIAVVGLAIGLIGLAVKVFFG